MAKEDINYIWLKFLIILVGICSDVSTMDIILVHQGESFRIISKTLFWMVCIATANPYWYISYDCMVDVTIITVIIIGQMRFCVPGCILASVINFSQIICAFAEDLNSKVDWGDFVVNFVLLSSYIILSDQSVSLTNSYMDELT